MLQRLNFSLDEELLYGDGLWPRDQLERMNASFVAAVETAFQLGLESRAAAAATVRLRSSLNGSRLLVEDTAIQAGWELLCSKEGEISFAEILGFVRERCPNIDPMRVRFGFEQRFRQRGGVGW
jgi:hypothetical protein